MRIATWNVNSLRIRLGHVTRWLHQNQPDVLLLQETKVEDALFPLDPFLQLGYRAAVHGQKSYNGVAILSRHPLQNVVNGFASYKANDHARLISATIQGVRVISVYVPNGGELGSEKFMFKQEFYRHLTEEVKAAVAHHPKLVIGGDFNVAADARDVDDPEKRVHEVLFTPQEQQWLADFRHNAGVSDAFRHVSQEAGVFSWWDYRDLGFQKNKGVRIDYLFVSPALLPAVTALHHDRAERKLPQPSDHIPVILALAG